VHLNFAFAELLLSEKPFHSDILHYMKSFVLPLLWYDFFRLIQTPKCFLEETEGTCDKETVLQKTD